MKLKLVILLLLSVVLFSCQNEENIALEKSTDISTSLNDFFVVWEPLSVDLSSSTDLENSLNTPVKQQTIAELQTIMEDIVYYKNQMNEQDFQNILNKAYHESNINATQKTIVNESMRAQCTGISCGLMGCTYLLSGKSNCLQQANTTFLYGLISCFGSSNALNCFIETIVYTLQEIQRINSCGQDVECCPFPCV
ncbi:MAG: hypothetical protein R2753_11360 [Chitinophagales bacterium]